MPSTCWLVLCVALSEAVPAPADSLADAALIAPNNNHVKSDDCVKKWMTPGFANFVDHNPHVQTPEIVDKISFSFWLKPHGPDQCTQDAQNVWHYIYDARKTGGGAVAIKCDQVGDRMWYSPEIKRFQYWQFSEGWDGSTPGTATKLQSCERKINEEKEIEVVCDEDANSGWSAFPTYGQWVFAYFEERKRSTGPVTVLGKDCSGCGIARSRAAFGANLASVMIWREALSNAAVKTLANGHLPSGRNPVVAYVGDFAHDQDQRWPRAGLEAGAEAIINEAPPSESFGKGALHYESGLPFCIHYYTARSRDFSRLERKNGPDDAVWDDAVADALGRSILPPAQNPQPAAQYPQPAAQYPQAQPPAIQAQPPAPLVQPAPQAQPPAPQIQPAPQSQPIAQPIPQSQPPVPQIQPSGAYPDMQRQPALPPAAGSSAQPAQPAQPVAAPYPRWQQAARNLNLLSADGPGGLCSAWCWKCACDQ